MLVLEEKKITIPEKSHVKSSSFIIERINIPEDLIHLNINITVPENYIKLVLIYDSNYNLRAEISNIHRKKEINIHEDEALTSIGAKPGPIPAGEWIIAFEAEPQSEVSSRTCILTVLGHLT